MVGRNNKEEHITVLLKEAVDILQVQKGDVIVDATLGNGGHTLELLNKVGENGKVIAIDLDKEAIVHFKNKIKNNFPELENKLILVNDNFKNIKNILAEVYARGGIKFDKVDGILADLGWRIEQVQNKRYGMSFQREMPLDMRMSPETQKLTAKEIINNWEEEDLSNIFRELGGEGYFDAQKIAKKIIDSRAKEKIETTSQLAELIAGINLKIKLGINPATKVFQALRITVNEELSNLNEFLEGAVDVLEGEARLGIISFHSLEDRLVKNFFRAKARGCVCPKEIPVCVCSQKSEVKILKSIKPNKKEILVNVRARSARLRIIEKRKIKTNNPS